MRRIESRLSELEAEIVPPEHLGIIVVFGDDPTPDNPEGRDVIRVRFVDPREAHHEN